MSKKSDSPIPEQSLAEIDHQKSGSERSAPDLLERGGPVRGVPQSLNARLFLQLQVFTGCLDTTPVVEVISQSGLEAVVYTSLNDPCGVGVLVMAEDPTVFVEAARSLFLKQPFSQMTLMPNFTMIGRTYAAGREPDLEHWLLRKPRQYALNPEYPWAVWYPLRRVGAFNQLSKSDQGKILAEHATLGRAYGEAGYVVDIRLECHGLDRDDNEFVLGLLGPELFPLSKLVKDMRSTRQTSEFIQTMGPFFVGRVIYQTPISDRSR